MMSLIVGLLTAAPARAEYLLTQPLFIAPKQHRALVRVQSGGKVTVVNCPIPKGDSPDLTFSSIDSLYGCLPMPAQFADTPATLAGFEVALRTMLDQTSAQFDVWGDNARATVTVGKWMAAVAVAQAIGVPLISKLLKVPAMNWAFVAKASLGSAAVMGVATGASEYRTARDYRRAARVYKALATHRATNGDQPLILDVDAYTLWSLHMTMIGSFYRATSAPATVEAL